MEAISKALEDPRLRHPSEVAFLARTDGTVARLRLRRWCNNGHPSVPNGRQIVETHLPADSIVTLVGIDSHGTFERAEDRGRASMDRTHIGKELSPVPPPLIA